MTKILVVLIKLWLTICLKFESVTVWKAKNSNGGIPSVAVERQPSKTIPDVHPPEAQPVSTFRSFRFDTGPILQAVDAAFSN